MGKITRIYVEAKRSKNFQTQTVGIEMTIENDDKNKDDIVKKLQVKANELAIDALVNLT